VFDFTYDGPGVAKGGTGVLKVDGQAVDTQKMPRTIPSNHCAASCSGFTPPGRGHKATNSAASKGRE
jgi:hypothetical protein